MPEIPSIAAEAKRLKNSGVDILIALGHSGIEMDTQIARDVEDIDLVVGGHSHTFLYTGIQIYKYIAYIYMYIVPICYIIHSYYP